MRIALVVLLLSSLAVAQSQPQPRPAPSPRAASSDIPAAASTQADADAQAQQQRIDAARRDIQRMRSLVEQMDRNRAFASPGETPLNHEFQLNVELWRTLLDRLDKDLEPPQAPSKTAPQLK